MIESLHKLNSGSATVSSVMENRIMGVAVMPLVSESEYRAKERERDTYAEEERVCKNKIGSLSDQIAELDRAIEHMSEVNSQFKTKVKELDGLLGEKREFAGNRKNELITSDGGRLYSDAVYCRDRVINKALDDLEWLRNDLRCKRNDQYGILGRIQSALSSAGTWLKTNFFN